MSQGLDSDLWLSADWAAPAGICAGTSYRYGGVSEGPYASLNLALHVGGGKGTGRWCARGSGRPWQRDEL